MAPVTVSHHHVASLGLRSEEYSITVPKENGRAVVVHTDDRKLWEEYVGAGYDFCRMGESYRDRFDYVCGQWYLDEHKAIGIAFAVGLAMVTIVLLLFLWSTRRGQKRQPALLRRQGRSRKGATANAVAVAADEELGQCTHLPLSQVDSVVVVIDGEKGRGRSPSAWGSNEKVASIHNGPPAVTVAAAGPSSESDPGEPSYDSARLTGEFELDEAQAVKITTVRTAPV